LKLAENHLRGEKDFIVLNSDILGDFDFEKMIKFHKEKNAIATIMLKEL
jgi:NDP-sugar pyrophosphorylase family protein